MLLSVCCGLVSRTMSNKSVADAEVVVIMVGTQDALKHRAQLASEAVGGEAKSSHELKLSRPQFLDVYNVPSPHSLA